MAPDPPQPPKVSPVRPMDEAEEQELIQTFRAAERHKETLSNAIIRGNILVRFREVGYTWADITHKIGVSKPNGSKLIFMATDPTGRLARSDWVKSKYWSVDYEVVTWPAPMFEALVKARVMGSETSRNTITLWKTSYFKKLQLKNAKPEIAPRTRLEEHCVHVGDALTVLKTLPDRSVQCCVTSPPYYGVRDYDMDGQIGHESSPAEYLSRLVQVFREVRRVLREDGTLWLVMGDSYHNKQMRGIPWRLAFALQNDGWILRRDIIWHKLTPTPEKAHDRPTSAHDYVFLLAKRQSYYYDAEAIAQPIVTVPHKAYGSGKAAYNQDRKDSEYPALTITEKLTKNIRDVWSLPTERNPELHFATYPTELARLCILAGCPQGGTVIDPFAGTGTTGIVAITHGRKAILIELNPDYAAMMNSKLDRYGRRQEKVS